MENDEILEDPPVGREIARLVLAHGAGAGMDTPFMGDLSANLSDRGVRVFRFEFPYMRQRRISGSRPGPDRPQVLLDSWREAIRRLGGGPRLVIGGKSMGGRIASMVADAEQARGLLCLGYPFHPPGRPGQLRTDHLLELKTPTLVLQGERDPFGGKEEVERYPLSSAIRVRWLPDGDHGWKPRKSSGQTLESNLKLAVEEIVGFLRGLKE